MREMQAKTILKVGNHVTAILEAKS
jgi:hypothetical protein